MGLKADGLRLIALFYGKGIQSSRGELSKARKLAAETCSKNKKGCDFGYAPVTNSCEGANDPDTCTVTALDATSAFAEPDPGYPSQGSPVFSGPVAHRVAPVCGSPSLLRIG